MRNSLIEARKERNQGDGLTVIEEEWLTSHFCNLDGLEAHPTGENRVTGILRRANQKMLPSLHLGAKSISELEFVRCGLRRALKLISFSSKS